MTEMNQLELELPEDFDTIEVKYPLVDEGYYGVTVHDIEAHDDNTVRVQFQILDEGRHVGLMLFQRFVMTTPPGKRLFKEFLQAIQVEPKGKTLSLALCKRAVLNVRVKHNENDGKTYANVAEHLTGAAGLSTD